MNEYKLITLCGKLEDSGSPSVGGWVLSSKEGQARQGKPRAGKRRPKTLKPHLLTPTRSSSPLFSLPPPLCHLRLHLIQVSQPPSATTQLHSFLFCLPACLFLHGIHFILQPMCIPVLGFHKREHPIYEVP